MENHYKNAISLALLTAAIASPLTSTAAKVKNAEASDTNKEAKHAVTEVYGSFMTGGNELQEKTISFYDSQNRLVRQGTYGKDGMLTKYFNYEYNQDGKLAKSFTRLYNIQSNGLYDLGNATDPTYYIYNSKGQLTTKYIWGAYTYSQYNYTYTEDGSLKTQEYLTGTRNMELIDPEKGTYEYTDTVWTRQEMYTYSDFAAKDCPQKVIYENQYSDQNYEGEMTYNADGKLLTETDYTVSDGTKTFKKSLRNEYDENGNLTLRVRHQSQATYDDSYMTVVGYETVPVDSVIYTKEDENRTKEVTFTYDSYNKLWDQQPSYNVTETRVFDGAKYSVTGYVEKMEGKANTNIFHFTIPAKEQDASEYEKAPVYVYDIYRDGLKICRYYPQAAESKAGFIDESIANGDHDYYVQTVEIKDSTEIGYNITDLATIESYTQLPAPTNVHGVSKQFTGSTSYMTYAWDAPAYTEDMGFIGYNVMTPSSFGDGCENAETPNIKETEYTSEMFNYYTEKTLYIQAVYALGYANSDTVTIKMDDLDDLASVQSIKTDNGTVSYLNNVITLSDAANITVSDMSGMKMAEAKKAKSLSIANLPHGAYMITTEKDGKLAVLKVRK